MWIIYFKKVYYKFAFPIDSFADTSLPTSRNYALPENNQTTQIDQQQQWSHQKKLSEASRSQSTGKLCMNRRHLMVQ